MGGISDAEFQEKLLKVMKACEVTIEGIRTHRLAYEKLKSQGFKKIKEDKDEFNKDEEEITNEEEDASVAEKEDEPKVEDEEEKEEAETKVQKKTKLAQDADGEGDEEEDAKTTNEEGIAVVEERADRDSEEKTEGGEEEIEEGGEEQEEGVQDRSNISETKEHLHLDVLDQQMAETQRVGQSHKSSNGSETIFTKIAEEISKEELPQPIGRAPPDRRRPCIRCRSFISACGDIIVDVNDNDHLNVAENNGVFVLKIKSDLNILVGEE